jgi:hypothetical protein
MYNLYLAIKKIFYEFIFIGILNLLYNKFNFVMFLNPSTYTSILEKVFYLELKLINTFNIPIPVALIIWLVLILFDDQPERKQIKNGFKNHLLKFFNWRFCINLIGIDIITILLSSVVIVGTMHLLGMLGVVAASGSLIITAHKIFEFILPYSTIIYGFILYTITYGITIPEAVQNACNYVIKGCIHIYNTILFTFKTLNLDVSKLQEIKYNFTDGTLYTYYDLENIIKICKNLIEISTNHKDLQNLANELLVSLFNKLGIHNHKLQAKCVELFKDNSYAETHTISSTDKINPLYNLFLQQMLLSSFQWAVNRELIKELIDAQLSLNEVNKHLKC